MTALCAGMLVAYALDFALRMALGWRSARAGARLDTTMSGEVLHYLVQLPYRHIELAQPLGDDAWRRLPSPTGWRW